MTLFRIFSLLIIFVSAPITHAAYLLRNGSCASKVLNVPNRIDVPTGGLTVTRCPKGALAVMQEYAEKENHIQDNRVTQVDAYVNYDGFRYKKLCRITKDHVTHAVTLVTKEVWNPDVLLCDVMNPSPDLVLCDE